MRPKNNIENNIINHSKLKFGNFRNNYFQTTYNTNYTNYTDEIQKNFKKIHLNNNSNLINNLSKNKGYKNNIFENKNNNYDDEYKKIFYSTINYNNYNINKKEEDLNKNYETKNNENNDNNFFTES